MTNVAAPSRDTRPRLRAPELPLSHSTDLIVDAEAGIVRNVSIIAAGVANSANAGEFVVDHTTLQNVADAINASPSGIKSRITHPELEGKDGFSVLVGKFRNARVDGDRVRADFFGGTEYASADDIRRICGLAKTAPEDAGVSIVFGDDYGWEQGSAGGLPAARLGSLTAIDWTDNPGANPTGMLSRGVTHASRVSTTSITPAAQGRDAMMLNEDQRRYLESLGLPFDADDEAINAFIAKLTDEQKSTLDAMAAPQPVKPEDAEPEADEGEGGQRANGGDDPAAANGELPDEGEDKKKTPPASSKPTGNKPVLTAAQREQQRYRSIEELRALSGDQLTHEWVTEMYLSGNTVDEARQIALSKVKQTRGALPMSSISVGDDRNVASLGDAVRDAIMLRAGSPLIKFDPKNNQKPLLSSGGKPEYREPHGRVDEFRYITVLDMGRRYLSALGYRKAESMSRAALGKLLMNRHMLQAALPNVYLAHSTGDFPNILADVMGQSLRREYVLASPTWREWCSITSAPDFKEQKMLQLSGASDLVDMEEGEEYTYGTISESKETFALVKKGLGLKFTRESLINDHLDAFNRLPKKLGQSAVRAEETTAISILTTNAALSDSIALFHADHNNLATGVVNVANVGSAEALMMRQTDLGSSDPLEIMARILLTPVELAITAQQFVSSPVDPAKSNQTPNPYANRLRVVPSARLSIDSELQWYLLADPNEFDTVVMCFLEGEEGPTLEEEDEFDDDTRKMKVRHHVVAKAIDYRGMVRSSGS